MKKIRAVVEISVPEKVELSEDDFAKLLRKQMLKGVHLMPHESASRQVHFKAFYRVVQYGPDGARMVPPISLKPFEYLVLYALWTLIIVAVKPAHRAKSRLLQEWFVRTQALLEASE